MQIKALLFDMGNVLIEINFVKLMLALGIQCENEAKAAAIIESWPFHDLFERGKISAEQFRSSLNKELKQDFTAETLEHAWNAIFVQEVAEMNQLLEKLKKQFPLYLLSNTNPIHMKFCLNHFPSLQHFRRRFVSYELGARKPESEIFDKVIEQIGIPRENILFFDDMPSNVAAARKMGLKSECAVRSAESVVTGIQRNS